MSGMAAKIWQRLVHIDRKEMTLMFALLLLVLGQNSWNPGFHPDGYIYAGVAENASKSLENAIVSKFTPNNYPIFHMHPPLVTAINGALLRIVPHSWTGHRLIQVLWAMATALVLYGLLMSGKDPRYREWGFWSVVLLALCPHFIKLSRYPNLDIPLTFFICLSLLFQFLAISKDRPRDWVFSGLFFGLALLSKGPQAVVVLINAGFFLISTKQLKKLLSPWPWIGLLVGGLVFSLWPLALASMGKLEVFWAYIDVQILPTVVNSRGKADLDFFGYFRHILKTSPHICLLAIFALIPSKRLLKNPIGLFLLSWCLAVLIPFSFMRWKYSHYIASVYPALVGIAGYGLSRFDLARQLWLRKGLTRLMYIAGFALLLLPITKGPKRDPELLKALEVYRQLPHLPEQIIVLDHVIGEYNIKNLFGMRVGKDIDYESYSVLGKDGFSKLLLGKQTMTFLSSDRWVELSDQLGESYQVLYYFPRLNTTLIIHRELLDLGLIFSRLGP